MSLYFRSFTRSALPSNRVRPAETRWRWYGKRRGWKTEKEAIEDRPLPVCSVKAIHSEIQLHHRSGMGACVSAACHGVHFLPVLQGPPSGHPPGRCLANLYLLKMPINLLQTQGTWSARWPPNSRGSLVERLVSRISIREMSHMSKQPQFMLTDYAGNESHLSPSQQPLVGHKVRPATAKDSPKRPGTKGIKSQSQIPGQSQSLTSIEQDWKHQGPEDSDFRPLAQVRSAPHPVIQ